MADTKRYDQVSWDELSALKFRDFDDDHPWPRSDPLTLHVYGVPLRTNFFAFSIGRAAPGESVDYHTHRDAEEVYVLLRGGSQINIDGDVIEAAELDAFRIPADVPRSVYNHTDEEAVWMFIGAPIDEYLESATYNPK